MYQIILRSPLLLFFTLLLACASPSPAPSAGVELVPVISNLDRPWGMDFMPDGSLLVTEKGGTLQHIELATGQRRAVPGVPASVVAGQGGLLDVMVAAVPGDSPWVYLSYVVDSDTESGYTTRIARARWNDGELETVQVLFTAQPYYTAKRHFGSRLLIADDYLYFTVGDRGNRLYAQDLSRHNGKVMRLHLDGSVPADNPFVAVANARPEIWSYGHRNPQGIARHPRDKSIWVVEHGPQGGDEINRLRAGANYGWPVITYGEEYGGGKIGEGTHQQGMEQPLKYYVPSIATCGAGFYVGDRYPGWTDSLLVTALRGTHINRVGLTETGLGDEQRLFADSKLRFRDVQQGPDGFVYVLAGEDSLLKLTPVASD
jgi:glucose/arabinose dehydrogenase